MSQPWQLQGQSQEGPVKMLDPNQFQSNTAESAQNVAAPRQQQNGQIYGHQESNMSAASNESWDQAWGQSSWEDGWNNDGQWGNNAQQQVLHHHQQQAPPQTTQNAQYRGWDQQAWQQQQAYGQQYAEPHMQVYSAQPGLDSSQGSYTGPPSVDSSASGASGFYQMGGPQAYPGQNTDVPSEAQPQPCVNQFQEISLDGQPDVSSTMASSATNSEPKKDIPHTNSFSNMPYEPSPFDDIAPNTSLNKSLDSAAAQLGIPSTGDRVKFIIGSQPGSASNSGTQSPYPQTNSPGMNASGLQQEQVMPPQPQLLQQGFADTGVQSYNSHIPQAELHPGQMQTDHVNAVIQATSSVPERPLSTSSCASSHHSSHHSSAVSDSLLGQIPKHEGPSSVHSAQSSDSAHVENTPPVRHEDPMIGAVAVSSERHQRSYSGQSARSVDSLGLSQSLQSSAGSLQITENLQDSTNSQSLPQADGPPQFTENMKTASTQESAVMTGPPPMSIPAANQEEGNPFRKTDAGLAQACHEAANMQPVQPSLLPVDQTPQGIEMPVKQPMAFPLQPLNDLPAEQISSNVPQNASIPANAASSVPHPEELVTPEDVQPAGPAPPASSAAVSSAPTSLPLGAAENVRMVGSSPVVSHPGSPFKPPPKLSPPDTAKSVYSGSAVDGLSAAPNVQAVNTLQNPGASGPGPLGQSPHGQQPMNNPSTAAGYHMDQTNVLSEQTRLSGGGPNVSTAAQQQVNPIPGMPVGQLQQQVSSTPIDIQESGHTTVYQEANRVAQETHPVQATDQAQSMLSTQNQTHQQSSGVQSRGNPMQQVQTQSSPLRQQQPVPSGPQTAAAPGSSAQQPPSSNPGHVHSGLSGAPGAPGGHNPQPNVPNVSRPQNVTAVPQQQNVTAVSQQQNVTAVPQQQNVTAVPQQQNVTAVPQQQNVIAVPQQENVIVVPQQETSTPQSLSQTSSQLELDSLASVTLPSNVMDNTRDAELTTIEQKREQEERIRKDPRYDSRDPRDSNDDRDRRYDDRDRRYDDRRYGDRRYDDRDRRYDDRYIRDDPRYRPSSRGPPDDRYRDPYRPSSRQGYPEDRPRSRQGYPDDRPRSRQGYPDERYDRPRSRQGYPDDPRYGRPSSRQGYPDDPRDRHRDDPYRDPYRDGPSSRQGYPGMCVFFKESLRLVYEC